MAQKPSIDGFIPRRSPGMLGEQRFQDRRLPRPAPTNGLVRTQPVAPISTRRAQPAATNALTPTDYGLERPQTNDVRHDIDESLRGIDADGPSQQKPPKRGGRRPNRRKIIKWSLIILLIAGLGVGAWLGVKTLLAGGAVFKGDVLGLIQHKELKMDANGRSNILVLGTSEDDPGHPGAYLTDSIMVVSVDQKNKNAYMISIPRDLQVKYGMACNSGYAGKVNEYFNCVNGDWDTPEAEEERQASSREFFGNIVGLDIQYSAHVNYSVLRDTVAALGGITVTIESPDPRGQMDGNFDWKCGATYAQRIQKCPPRGHFIDYPNGPVELDAEHALYLAQARGDTPVNWGFPNSNFEREKNQQKIMVAIKEKAMSTGTLTNLGKVTGLIDALGNNLRTNFDTSEIRTLMSLAHDIPSPAIQSISLIDNELVGGDAQPTAGLYDFTQIQAFIKKKLNSSPLAKEGAHVVVLNASGVAGAAQTEADKLTALGMEIDGIDNAPEDQAFPKNTLYQLRATTRPLPLSLSKLTQQYGATVKTTTTPPVAVDETTDFILILVTPPATGETSP